MTRREARDITRRLDSDRGNESYGIRVVLLSYAFPVYRLPNSNRSKRPPEMVERLFCSRPVDTGIFIFWTGRIEHNAKGFKSELFSVLSVLPLPFSHIHILLCYFVYYILRFALFNIYLQLFYICVFCTLLLITAIPLRASRRGYSAAAGRLAPLQSCKK